MRKKRNRRHTLAGNRQRKGKIFWCYDFAPKQVSKGYFKVSIDSLIKLAEEMFLKQIESSKNCK